MEGFGLLELLDLIFNFFWVYLVVLGVYILVCVIWCIVLIGILISFSILSDEIW